MIRLSASLSREAITQPLSAANSRAGRPKAQYARHSLRRGENKRINLTPSPDGYRPLLKILNGEAGAGGRQQHHITRLNARRRQTHRLFHRLDLLGDFGRSAAKLRAIARPKQYRRTTIAGQIARASGEKSAKLTVAAQQLSAAYRPHANRLAPLRYTAALVAFEVIDQRTPLCSTPALEAMRARPVEMSTLIKLLARGRPYRHPPAPAPLTQWYSYAARKLHLFHVQRTFSPLTRSGVSPADD